MKRFVTIAIMIALLALGVTAVQISAPLIGGENQDRNANISTTFTVTNNNSNAFTVQSITVNADARYHIVVPTTGGNVPTTISPGATATITINGFIPLDFAGIDTSDFKPKSFPVGTVAVSGTAGAVAENAITNVSMQAINQLRIRKVHIDCDAKAQSLTDGDTVKNLKPGNKCSLEVEVENQFDSNDRNGLKIGDVSFDTVNVRSTSSNRDVNIDVSNDVSSLNANDKDTANVDVDIDENANDGKATLEFTVIGRDANSATHGDKISVKLDVVRLTHDIQIRRVELSPNRVSNCEASNVKAIVNVLNQGKRNEKRVAIEVAIPDFKFSKKSEDLQLDKDDSTGVNLDIVVPKGTRAGVVRADVRTYFDTVALSNSGSVDLTVEPCNEPATQPEPAKTVVVTQPTVTSTVVSQPQPVVPVTSGVSATKKTTTFTDSPAYVAVLAVVSVIVLVLIVALIVTVTRRKQP